MSGLGELGYLAELDIRDLRCLSGDRAPHSSGLVWDDRFLSGKLNQVNNKAGDKANKPKDPDGRKEPTRDSEKLSRTARSPLPPIETAALERNHNYNHT
ncbi:hypothetical protein CDL15_Pgr020647 [Punica granatum]|uniref:Uncharacterized protein n=1 Tax=Punica granatum TaxID=22663 RepID=A0A218XHI2_PUNGR|nr:hypothetical protein CDL15_Pgr020647 [Punica granatum]